MPAYHPRGKARHCDDCGAPGAKDTNSFLMLCRKCFREEKKKDKNLRWKKRKGAK